MVNIVVGLIGHIFNHNWCYEECIDPTIDFFYIRNYHSITISSHLIYIIRTTKIHAAFLNFYPRPVLAFGYFRCLRLCVCLSVCQSLACPRDNSGPVQARIGKFGPKMRKTLVKVPIVLWTDRPWPSRSNLTWKSKFTLFWGSLHRNSPPIQARITKFVPEVQNTLVKILIVLGGNWPWPSRSNMTWIVKFSGFTLLEIHNHHITTREPWVPRLFHRPDGFTVSILCMCSYA